VEDKSLAIRDKSRQENFYNISYDKSIAVRDLSVIVRDKSRHRGEYLMRAEEAKTRDNTSRIPKRYFDKKEFAAYVKKSTKWVERELASASPPPGFKMGGEWRFEPEQIDQWITKKFRG
jgi:predicted DNA-binding transcriptional regulator AlpA